MSQDPNDTSGPMGPNGHPPPDERLEGEPLSGTLFSTLRGVASALGGFNTTFVSVGIVAAVLGIALIIFLSDLRLYGYIILAAAGVALLLALAVSFGTVSRALTSRRGRYGTNTVLLIVSFIGIAALVNFLAFENSARMDVTATKQFSLAPRTLDLLKHLDQDLEAKAFFVPGRNAQEQVVLDAMREQTENFFREFKVRSGRFSYKFVDPIVDPLTAAEYGARSFPTIVIEAPGSKKRHQVAPSAGLEQDLVTALLIITGQEQKRVYFLSGHGEADPTNNAPDTPEFGLARDGIESENYAASTINLSLPEGRAILQEDRQQNRVNMVVVASPKKELQEEETQVLHDYLKNGGNMLFLMEPGSPSSFIRLLGRWGILVGDGHIVDEQRHVGDDKEITVLARDQYFRTLPDPLQSILGIDTLTTGLDTTYYPGVTSLGASKEGVAFFPDILEEQGKEEDPEKRPATVFGTALGFTSGESWLIRDPTRNEPREEEGDVKGTFFPAVAVRAFAPVDEPPPTSPADLKVASIVAIGDSDFATNRHFFSFANSDFFLNSVNWLVGDAPLASIRPKPSPFRALVLTKNEFDFIRYSGWLLLPILMAASGGFVWWRRH